MPVYKSISTPTDSIEIETPSGTNLTFMTVTLPGMCSNGIYFSTLPLGTLRFTQGGQDFHNLSAFDDKCLVFGSQQKVDLVLTILSQDHEDQLYVYYNFTNFTSISGNDSLILSDYDARGQPLFVRVVADDARPPHDVDILYVSSASMSRSPRYDYALPPVLLQECDEPSTASQEPAAIALIVVIGIIGGGLLIWICSLSIRQTATNPIMPL
jgi:hypothetical protein